MHATRFTRPMVAIGWFLVHFAEMWVAMMIGMLVFHAVLIPAFLAVGVSAMADGREVTHQVGMGLSMAVPMVVWMRVIGCGWREGLAMAAAMLLPWAVVLVLCAAGFADQLPWLNGFAGTAMLLGMLAFMLYRWRHYARPMGIIPMWARHRFAVRAGRAPEAGTT